MAMPQQYHNTEQIDRRDMPALDRDGVRRWDRSNSVAKTTTADRARDRADRLIDTDGMSAEELDVVHAQAEADRTQKLADLHPSDRLYAHAADSASRTLAVKIETARRVRASATQTTHTAVEPTRAAAPNTEGRMALIMLDDLSDFVRSEIAGGIDDCVLEVADATGKCFERVYEDVDRKLKKRDREIVSLRATVDRQAQQLDKQAKQLERQAKQMLIRTRASDANMLHYGAATRAAMTPASGYAS